MSARWTDGNPWAHKSAPKRRVPVTLDGILHAAAAKFGVTVAELRSHDRRQPLALIRQLAMAEARRHDFSYPAIAAAFNREHSTVIHAVRVIETRAAAHRRRLRV